ncbi:MAG: hypothetical protein WA172_00400 [Terriglobales bacterium]
MKIQYRLKRKAWGQIQRTTNGLRGWLPALAIAALSALCILPSASAQTRAAFPYIPSSSLRGSDAQIRAHIARAKGQVLTADDVSTFQTNLTSLVNFLVQSPTGNPNQQALINDLQTQINGMDSTEITGLANYTDVNAFNSAVTILTTTVPQPKTLPPSDPPANLVPPPYGYCQETPAGVLPSIPSDTPTDRALLITLEVLEAVQIVADENLNLFISILGEDNNLPDVIIAIVVDLIVFAIQTTSDELQFCDPYTEAAEVYAGWQNSIVIDTDIANLALDAGNQFTLLENQLTTINDDIDTHISSIAGNTNNQYIQINNEITALSNNFSSQATSVDLDIDNHIATVSIALANSIASVDADVKNATTSLSTSISNELTKLDTDVLNQAAQTNSGITAFQTLDVSLDIQHALSSGLSVGLFELPSSQGGYIQTLRAIVANAISSMTAAGQSVGTAAKSLAQGDTALAGNQYKTAYQDYLAAYQAVK